jgi:hypothetical protein
MDASPNLGAGIPLSHNAVPQIAPFPPSMPAHLLKQSISSFPPYHPLLFPCPPPSHAHLLLPESPGLAPLRVMGALMVDAAGTLAIGPTAQATGREAVGIEAAGHFEHKQAAG